MSHDRDDRPSGPGTETAEAEEAASGAPGSETAPRASDGGTEPRTDDGEAAAAREEERLSEEIREELQELEELRDRHVRLAAEFDNYRKRTRRELVEQRERAQADLIRDLLEVLDDLDRVADTAPESTSAGALQEGVEMVSRKFRKILEDVGLARIDAEDQRFDPNVHEALTSIPTEDPELDGRVADVVIPGYRVGERLLRPARVAVYQRDSGPSAAGESSSGAGDARSRETGSDADD